MNPTLNPDGVSVKGCTYIYAPKGKAGEYAKLACNPYKQCPHACRYCYVPNTLRATRERFHSGAAQRTDFMLHLIKEASRYQVLGITEQVMLSFSCDPYPIGYSAGLTRQVIIELQFKGLAVCTLSKGGSKALRDIDLFRPDRDCYATTLTTLDNAYSEKWEPGAAMPEERVETLKSFHDRGIFTWVSLEPVLDVRAAISIVEHTHQFVDLYKIGRANYLPMTKTADWKDFTLRMLDTVNRLGVKHYFKSNLQQYLPEVYYNPMHIPQHH